MHIRGCQIPSLLLAGCHLNELHRSLLFFFFLQPKECEKIQATTDILSICLSLNRVFFCCFLSSAEQAENGKHTVHLKPQDMGKERRGELQEAHFRDMGTMHERDIQTLKLCVTAELLLLCCLFLLIAVMFL